MNRRSFFASSPNSQTPTAPSYTSEDAKTYLFNLFIDSACVNIIGDDIEECLNQLSCCGKLAFNAIQELEIPSQNDIAVLFKMIARTSLHEAVRSKTPHEFLDIFATLNLSSNVVETFSTASCLAGFLSSCTADLYPSGIITLGKENSNSLYREQGENAFMDLRSAFCSQALRLWSESNPVHSRHWDVNIKRMLSPTLVNYHAVHNWVACRIHKLKYPRSSKLAYALHLGPLTRAGDTNPSNADKNVLLLTKSTKLSKKVLTEKISKAPEKRTISLPPATIIFLRDNDIQLTSSFSNPALLHPLRILSISQSKRIMILALRLYKAKIYDLHCSLTYKAAKIHSSLRLCSSLSDSYQNVLGATSRLTEIMEEASSRPLARIENLYTAEVNKIVNDIDPDSPADLLLNRLFKTINGSGRPPTWEDLLIKVASLNSKDATFIRNFCEVKGLAENMDDIIESSLISSDWILAEPLSPADIIDKIDQADLEEIARAENDHLIAKRLISKFCSYLTNNLDSDPEVSKLFPKERPSDSADIILSDSDDAIEPITSTGISSPNHRLDDLNLSPPQLSPIFDNGDDSPPFWSILAKKND